MDNDDSGLAWFINSVFFILKVPLYLLCLLFLTRILWLVAWNLSEAAQVSTLCIDQSGYTQNTGKAQCEKNGGYFASGLEAKVQALFKQTVIVYDSLTNNILFSESFFLPQNLLLNIFFNFFCFFKNFLNINSQLG